MQKPIFYYNGIKDAKGAELQKVFYSSGKLLNHPEGTLTIYKRDYGRFSALVHGCFEVQNDSDSMTDYFEKDRIRVLPGHPLYAEVLAAKAAADKHEAARRAKRDAKWAAIKIAGPIPQNKFIPNAQVKQILQQVSA